MPSPAVRRRWRELTGRYLEDPDQVHVVVSGDWLASLRKHAPAQTADNPAFADSAGIALRDGDERHIILLSMAKHFSGGALTAALRERVLGHESLHVATRQRNESMSGFGVGDGAPAGEVWYRNIAGTMIEEYRVELALHRDGLTTQISSQARLEQSLRYIRRWLTEAGPALASSSQLVYRVSQQPFYALAYDLAHAAAEVRGADGDPLSLLALDPDILGANEREIVIALGPIPDATLACSRDDLAGRAIALNQHLERWHDRLLALLP